MKNDVKLGIVGTNFVSGWLCDAIQETDGICAYAVCSRTEEKADIFAEKYHIQKRFCSYREFLMSDIDAVYIAIPNYLHYEYALEAIRHRKHVLVEKPACITAMQYGELLEKAAENQVIVMEAMVPGHDPILETLRNAIQQIGKIRNVSFDFCQYSSRYDKFRAGEVLPAFDPALGNAAIMDIGCYAVHLCVSLFGEPEKVSSGSIKLSNGFEGIGHILLQYHDFLASILYSKITESANPSVITGEDGSISISGLRLLESASLLPRMGVGPKDPNGKNVDWKAMFNPDGEDNRMENGEILLWKDRDINSMTFELSDFRDSISEVRENGFSLTAERYNEITLHAMQIIDQVREQNHICFS